MSCIKPGKYFFRVLLDNKYNRKTIPDRECPKPEEISFGTVSASGRLFGARASYSCEHGYHVVGLQSRTCQADGQWAGQAPACKQNSKFQ